MHMVVNQQPRLSPTLFTQLSAYAKFKAYFHGVSIKARKDPEKKWNLLLYMVTYMDIQEVVGLSPHECCMPMELDAVTSTGTEAEGCCLESCTHIGPEKEEGGY